VGHESSIYYGVVINADKTRVRIGSWTNVQDDTVISEALEEVGPDNDGSVVIGNYVTVLG
jgi:carbonic anhydrase/acetyltransferase-like protein (isoleucine patch superfamily)